MISKGLYINGKFSPGSGDVFQSFNPATGEIIWEGAGADANDVDSAVKSARRAFQSWREVPLEKRQKYLEAFAGELERQKDALADVISSSTGKPLWESLTEVRAMINKIPISLKGYQERCQEIEAPLGEARRLTRFKPHGVVGVLGPFNLPGHLPQGHIVPALLAGNTVVFKPSELTPLVGEKIAAIWEKVGIPAGVINLIQGARETGEALVCHPFLNGLYFTGSAAAGRLIHQHFAGTPEKILALEMGGNNPLIVSRLKDAAAAAYLTIQSAFITSGQRCTCARRLIITEGKDEKVFLEKLMEMTKKIKVGVYTERPEAFMGTVISKAAAQKILAAQTSLEQKGGKVLVKLERKNNHPCLLTPGIMDVTGINNLPDEEIFGPFLQVIRVKDFNEALQEANRTSYGLSAGLLTDERELYEQFLKEIRAGVVNWNQPLTGASSESPFGGIGRSGNHRPSAAFAADYCAYPVASLEKGEVSLPKELAPGVSL